MKLTFLTLFPDVIESYVNSSIIRNAQTKGLVQIEVINIRTAEFSQVDDYAYGGGVGMVMKAEPIVDCLRKHDLMDAHIVLLTPKGTPLRQEISRDLSASIDHMVLICGHYEGIDARIEKYVNQFISIGDYVITSGELSSLVLADSVIRLIPGVINEVSLAVESFDDFLLDFPVYTRPQEFEGDRVPDVYLNGHRKEIEKFRLLERIRITKERRPDLYDQYLKKVKKSENY